MLCDEMLRRSWIAAGWRAASTARALTSSSASPSSPAPSLQPQTSDRGQQGDGDALVKGARLLWSDKVNLKLRRRAAFRWEDAPRRVLLVKKRGDARVLARAREVVEFLRERGLEVLVEAAVADIPDALPGCTAWDGDARGVDLCVVLGGDGTLLHLSGLLAASREDAPRGPLPPCISFGMGSLGFMTNFEADRFAQTLAAVTDPAQDIYCTLRTRLMCKIKSSSGRTRREFECLNEVRPPPSSPLPLPLPLLYTTTPVHLGTPRVSDLR